MAGSAAMAGGLLAGAAMNWVFFGRFALDTVVVTSVSLTVLMNMLFNRKGDTGDTGACGPMGENGKCVCND